jgi:hypothetical protein
VHDHQRLFLAQQQQEEQQEEQISAFPQQVSLKDNMLEVNSILIVK